MLDELGHRVHRRLQIFARIKFTGVFGKHFADLAGHGHAVIGVDIHLAHAILDAALDFFHRHTPCLRHLTAIGVDDVLQILRHGRRAVHHEMGVRQQAVNFFNHMHGQNSAVWLAGEFIRAMRRAHCNGQSIHLRGADKIDRFLGVGQKLVMRERALKAVAIFLLALSGLKRAQNTKLTFHRNAAEMRHVGHRLCDADIVIPITRRLAVVFQRAIHHYRGKARLNRRHAGCSVVTMVEMHANRDLRINFRQRIHHVLQHNVVGIGPRTARCLDDDRRIHGNGCGHNGQRAFHIVDVEGRNTVAVLCSVIQQLSHGNARHGLISLRIRVCYLTRMAYARLKASTPGNGLPSSHSRKAPPAVDT